jgi:hypothetical protein
MELIQETWSGKKYDNDSDEEFMAMLLDDPTTQKIIEENKKLENKVDSESESDSERPELLPIQGKTSNKSKQNKKKEFDV